MTKPRELPPLQFDGRWAVDTLVPGFIVAYAGIQCGEPTLIGTRIPTYAIWPWEIRDSPEQLAESGLTREQVIALYSFQQGVKWQRDRKRRKRMEEAVMAPIEGIIVERKKRPDLIIAEGG